MAHGEKTRAEGLADHAPALCGGVGGVQDPHGGGAALGLQKVQDLGNEWRGGRLVEWGWGGVGLGRRTKSCCPKLEYRATHMQRWVGHGI